MQNLQETSRVSQIPPDVLTDEQNSAEEKSLLEIIERLPPGSVLRLFDRSWTSYENLLEAVGEASGLRISFNRGTLKIMTLSTEHENYGRLLQMMIGILCVHLRMEILSFGSATIKKSRFQRGTEPDACFYVQRAAQIGNKIRLDFAVDPAPDVVVEIDLHHESRDKFPIYAALDVSDIWRYSSDKLEIHRLESGEYASIEQSEALPVLSAAVLTEFLNRSRTETQPKVLFAFEDWLKSQK